MPPPVGKRAISIAFVCPSVCPFVCPSVAYIRLANNSRTQRPSTPNLEGRFPTFDVTRIPVWRSKGPKILIWHTSCTISSERQGLRTSDGGRQIASTTGATTSKVKAQGRKVTWSVWAVLTQCCTCVTRDLRGHTVSAEPGRHTSCFGRQ